MVGAEVGCLPSRSEPTAVDGSTVTGREVLALPGIPSTTRLRVLQADASHSDAAWNELVDLLTPTVEAVVRGYQLGPDAEERASRAAWAGLAKRLHLPNGPEDVAEWVSTRAHIECRRAAGDAHRVEALVLARRRRYLAAGAGLPDRRTNRDRRRAPRTQGDRRGAGGSLSPDVLAARLRHA